MTNTYIEQRKKFGTFLAEVRTKKGLSQADVAKRAGHASAQFISNIERGTVLPPVTLLRVLTKSYGVKPETMFTKFTAVKTSKDWATFTTSAKTAKTPRKTRKDRKPSKKARKTK